MTEQELAAKLSAANVLWSRREIALAASVSAATVERWSALPSFPKAVRFSRRMVRYWSDEVRQWIKNR
jgi:predicted DNA-binding transcriptional regulator AlpA